MQRTVLSAIAAFLLAGPAFGQVTVHEPWVRGTVAEQKATGAFMQLTTPTDARLVEVRSPVAHIVEIHEMTMIDNTMKMRAVAGIDLPAGKTVELKPGGYHVMLIELKAPLKAGDVVPLQLIVEGKDKKRETIDITAPVRALNAPAAPMSGHAKH